MYCKKCGKEIPDNAIFCTYCGTEQQNNKQQFTSIIHTIISWIKRHKIVTYFFSIWICLNIFLLTIAPPSYNVWGEEVSVRKFFPFCSHYYYGGGIEIEAYLEDYDFSEFFFYVVFLPLIILGIYKGYKYIKNRK